MLSALGWLVSRPIAHRGLHDSKAGRVENSMSAFEAAIEAGYAIECDVQVSRDGKAFVFHDFDLERLTGTRGRVDALDGADLSRLLLVGGGGDTLQPLDAVVEAIDGRTPLIVELKSRFDGDMRLADHVARTVTRMPRSVAIKSFDGTLITYLRNRLEEVPRGFVGMRNYGGADFALLSDEQKAAFADFRDHAIMRPDFLSWKLVDLPHGAERLRALLPEAPLMTWTVRSESDRDAALAYADQIVFEGFLPHVDRHGQS